MKLFINTYKGLSSIKDAISYIVSIIIHPKQHYKQGKGLKIVTPQQMFARLPIAFAQLQAGNNSQKLKNEIRQLLYSLYRSKKLSKTVYENLIKII